MDVGRLRGKRAIIDDLGEFTRDLVEELNLGRGMGVEIEVTD
jgi:hypothetical protein